MAHVRYWTVTDVQPIDVGNWAVSVDENWRLTFTFEGKDAVLVDYQDYH